jgi:hypothetical protein
MLKVFNYALREMKCGALCGNVDFTQQVNSCRQTFKTIPNFSKCGLRELRTDLSKMDLVE